MSTQQVEFAVVDEPWQINGLSARGRWASVIAALYELPAGKCVRLDSGLVQKDLCAMRTNAGFRGLNVRIRRSVDGVYVWVTKRRDSK